MQRLFVPCSSHNMLLLLLLPLLLQQLLQLRVLTDEEFVKMTL